MRKHGAFDIELQSGDEWYGFMVDHSAENSDVDVAEEDTSAQIALNYGSPAGDYNWKDQRAMPGVSINDFRGGQGQLVLDRADSASNAFRDGRFLDCGTEGEVKLAPGLLSVLVDDIDPVIIEADGRIFAAFIPAEAPATIPDSIRELVRYEVTLDGALIADTTEVDVVLTDHADVELDDWLYDPLSRELMQVTQLYVDEVEPTPDVPMQVTRAAGFFDNDLMNPQVAAHEDAATLYGYGWRIIPFTTGPPANPMTHCRSLAWDGYNLYAAFSDSSAAGELWKWNVASTKFSQMLATGINGITDIVWGAGRLYYSATNANVTTAGYIGYDAAGTAYEATQLSASAVVGEAWDTDHFETVERKLIEPLVDSKGLAVNNTWAYWMTTGGRSSFLYKMQAPNGFELVKAFPKGFIGTCLTAGFDNVYVGGYYPQADGSTQGAMYLVNGDVAERVVDLVDPNTDNTIQGLIIIGLFVYITTLTQVFCFSPKTAGWWHVMDIPPADPDTSVVPIADELWDDFPFNVVDSDLPQILYVDDWNVLSQTSSSQPVSSIEYHDSAYSLEVKGDNCDYRRYRYIDEAWTGTAATIVVDMAYFSYLRPRGAIPADGTLTEGKRRTLEMSISNGVKQTRLRVRGVLNTDLWWDLSFSLGRWNANRSRWVFETWVPVGHSGGPAFVLSLNADRAVARSRTSIIQEMPVAKLRNTTLKRIWFSGGYPLGDALALKDGTWVLDENAGITTTKPFRCCINEVRVVTEDLDQVYVATPPTETGKVAELDGELFLPIPGTSGSGQLCFTRLFETYAAGAAYVETSDSYQGMGTSRKFYRRVELAHSMLLDNQDIEPIGLVDDTYCEPTELVLTSAAEYDPSRFTMRGINTAGVKCRALVSMVDSEHLRPPEEKLKLHSVALRFLPNTSSLKHVYTVACIDDIEARDGTKWSFNAADAIAFIKDLKLSGRVVELTDDEGTYEGVIDSYIIKYAKKDENAHSSRQGTVQFTVKKLEE